MKRNERNTLYNLRKTVNAETIYVEIPASWTHEARQAIHELLTVQKRMKATCMGPNVITGETCIRYTRDAGPSDAERQKQESADVDDVMKALPVTKYTWNGYKVTEESAEAEKKNDAEKPAEKLAKKAVKFYDVDEMQVFSVSALRKEWRLINPDISFDEYLFAAMRENGGNLIPYTNQPIIDQAAMNNTRPHWLPLPVKSADDLCGRFTDETTGTTYIF